MGCGASSIETSSANNIHRDLTLDTISAIPATKTSDSTASSAASITTMELRQWTTKHRLASRQAKLSARHSADSPENELRELAQSGRYQDDQPAAVGGAPVSIVQVLQLNFIETPGTPTEADDSQFTSQLSSPLLDSISSRAVVTDSDISPRSALQVSFLGRYHFPESEPQDSQASTPRTGLVSPQDEDQPAAPLHTDFS